MVVMKGRERVLLILMCMLITIAIVLGVFYLINEQNDTMLKNKGDENELIDSQYKLLENSIFYAELEEMNDVRRKNALMFLNAMKEKGFTENTYPGQSGVGVATWILDLLNMGELKEFKIISYDNDDIRNSNRGPSRIAGHFVARVISENGGVYYLLYSQTWGLQVVTKESEYGEIIYDSAMHTIIDEQIYEREFPRGSIH